MNHASRTLDVSHEVLRGAPWAEAHSTNPVPSMAEPRMLTKHMNSELDDLVSEKVEPPGRPCSRLPGKPGIRKTLHARRARPTRYAFSSGLVPCLLDPQRWMHHDDQDVQMPLACIPPSTASSDLAPSASHNEHLGLLARAGVRKDSKNITFQRPKRT